jgi:hypothetical protein
MIKVEMSMTIYIDPLDLMSTYIDEETIREYVEAPIKEALSDVNELIINHIDIEGLE